MTYLVFDIETGPVPDEELERLFTYDETAIKGYNLLAKEFDPSEVKHGNTKDPEKIAAKVQAAREDFEKKKSGVKALLETGRADAWDEFKGRAALSALTGQVLAVGFWCDKWDPSLSCLFVNETTSEYDVIAYTLATIDAIASQGGKVIGHNIIGFDLLFLLHRGLKHGIKPPVSIVGQMKQYAPTALIDLQREWQFGVRSEKYAKLDTLAAYFGVTRKNGNGANFYRLFNGGFEAHLQALQYLENDIRMTIEIARKMGVIQ